MDLALTGKKALITAGGRGIGQGIAECLAAGGASIAVVARSKNDVNSLVQKLGGSAKGHVAIAMDLVEEGAPQILHNTLLKNGFGDPDIAIHNLGGTLDKSDPYCSLADWRAVWRINVEVAVELNNLLLPAMRSKKWGRIVHTSSISSVENHGPVPYCAAKAALNAYTRSMGRVVSADGIIMTAILPGAIFTEGGYWDEASKHRPEHVEKYLAERMAIHRFGKISEVSNLVAFLCSDHAGFCVGSIFPVDGGQGRGFFGY